MSRVDVGAFALSLLASLGGAAAFIAAWSWRAGSRMAALEKASEEGREALRLAREHESAVEVMSERLMNDRQRQEERWRETKEMLAEIRALTRNRP